MAGKSGTHADDVEEPGADGRERPGLKIVVNESVSGFAVVAAKKGEKVVAAEMMKDSGGDIDLAAEIRGKSVAMKKAARKRFDGGEAGGFTDER